MVIYIVLAVGYIITCNVAGCVSVSQTDFNVLKLAGLLELMFEIPGIIIIYFRKRR